MTGATYAISSTDFVRRLLRQIAPSHYVHIGSYARLAELVPGTRSVCLDPYLHSQNEVNRLGGSLKIPGAFDNYFESPHAAAWFAGVRSGVALIDGIHRCQNVLRDFHNIEQNIGSNAVVLIDLVLPAGIEITGDVFVPGRPWAGDVWKAVAVLRALRPSLAIDVYRTQPFGIAVLTNLDPTFRASDGFYANCAATAANLMFQSQNSLISRYNAQNFSDQVISDIGSRIAADDRPGDHRLGSPPYDIQTAADALHRWKMQPVPPHSYRKIVTEAASYQRPAADIGGAERVPPEFSGGLAKFLLADTPQAPQVELLFIPNAHIFSRGIVITPDRTVLDETISQFFHRGILPERLEVDADHKSCIIDIPEVAGRHYGEAILLKSFAADNYGHWLIESLPRVLMLRAMRDLTGLVAIVSPAASDHYRRMVTDSVRLFSDGKIECMEIRDSEIHYCEAVWATTPLAWHPDVKSPFAIGLIENLVTALRNSGALAGNGESGNGIVYVSRKMSAVRRLLNEDAVVGIIKARGGAIIFPETLSFVEQLGIFSSATCVVGVMGAALTNMVFAPRGAKVVALAPGTMMDPFFWDLAAIKSQIYACIYGLADDPAKGQNSDFWIDEAELARVLQTTFG